MKEGDGFVVDSQVVTYAFREDAGQAVPGSASALDFFRLIVDNACSVFLDADEHIQEEWGRHLPTEWFDLWFFDFVATANVQYIKPDPCLALLRKLRVNMGFPSGENVWLVKVAVSAGSKERPCALVSEDMDFRDPRQKRCTPTQRARYLSGDVTGSVSDELWKHHVEVVSIELALL